MLMRHRWLLLACAVAGAAAVKRNNRDWAHMTDADWNRIEEDLEDPEDRAEREAANEKMKRKFDAHKQGLPAGFDMAAFQNAKTDEERQKLLSGLKTPKKRKEGQGLALGHVFVTVRGFEGCCTSDRKAITELGRKWSGLLASTGMDAGFSIWKDNQLAFETKHEAHVKEITDFALMQPEAAVVRHDLEDTYGPAATPEFVAEWEQAIKDREAAKDAKIAANRKAAEKRKKQEEKKAKLREKKAAKAAAAATAAAASTGGEAPLNLKEDL